MRPPPKASLSTGSMRSFTGTSRSESPALEAARKASTISRVRVRSAGVGDAAEHYDEQALAALILHVGLTNLFNRINVTTRQPAGDW